MATTLAARIVPIPSSGLRLVERNFLVYRRSWLVFVSGFFEPVFYLLSIGVGVAALVGDFTLAGGTVVSYTAFVAPAMLASSAMNGAIFDSTYNIFFKMKYLHLYDAILATPMRPWNVATGEITWALLRGACYSAAFIVVMLVMGLIDSWWALLALPVSVLIAFAFAAAGMALTTFMRSWQDFEFVQVSIMPMFLFSATFYPVETYPTAVQWIVEATPLYQGVALIRALTTGSVGWHLLIHVAYLAAMGGIGLYVASRRLGRLLLK
ncbi:ABC transporter permease [Kribbella sp. NBC_01245]|uniref:ABC transporter permease n=1 Tax=Kribbella sp. NBC_01245 TaxID=2903578 RepID=UPI002E28CF74|nr:ABC transporter permease [Kribbella sp. NBC_01245]